MTDCNIRFRIIGHIFSFLILLALSFGCQSETRNLSRVPQVNTQTPRFLPSSTPISATETIVPTPEAIIFPTQTPTPQPLPPISLSVPDFLSSSVTAALQKYEEEVAFRQIIVRESGSQADVRLVPGNNGVPAGSRPVAVTVPFTSEIESITKEQADQILLDGHPFIEPIDWSRMPLGRKALRVDGLLPFEEGYSLLTHWSLESNSEFREYAAELAPFIKEEIGKENIVQLSAVGDIMLDRALGVAISQGNIEFPFALLASQLSSADITLGNLESSLGNIGVPEAKSYTFQAPPKAVESLAFAGFDVLSLANNHALDYGSEALLQAIDLLAAKSIATIGAGPNHSAARQPRIIDVNGIKLAFLAYVDVPVEVSGFDTKNWQATEDKPGLVWAELPLVETDVKKARDLADIVIVVLHSGYEYVEAPSPQQSAVSRAAIQAGADLVIGHHAHVLQGVEFSETGVIVYGLGNFAFEIDGQPETAILNVWLDEDGVRQIEFIPAVIQFGGQPRLANEPEKFSILGQIYRLTNALN